MATSPQKMLTEELRGLLRQAVDDGAAPGLVAVVCTQRGVVLEAAAGHRDAAGTLPMTVDTTCMLASMSKVVASMAALALVDKHQLSLDDPDTLTRLLPEFKLPPLTQMFEDVTGENDAEGQHSFRTAAKPVTLRHLFTHTSGIGDANFDKRTATLYQPYGSLKPRGTCAMEAIVIPRIFEAGSSWIYGYSAEWIGILIERLHGTGLRQALQDLVLRPCGVPADSLDTFRTQPMNVNRASMSSRDPSGGFQDSPLDTPQWEGTPPPGYTVMAGGPLHGTGHSLGLVISAVLNKSAPAPSGKPLISQALWDEATCDGLKPLGLSFKPITSAKKAMSNDFSVFSPHLLDDGSGQSVESRLTAKFPLSTMLAMNRSSSGRQAGTLSWGGLPNCYWFADPVSGVGGVLLAQLLPFMDAKMLQARESFEKFIYEHLDQVNNLVKLQKE